MNEVKGQKEKYNFKEDYFRYENFEFSDFTTFSKNENLYNCNSITKPFDNNLTMISSERNNFLFNKHNNDNDMISVKETNSRYKSTKSNNTLNNYCSIHQINGNFQTLDIEPNQLSIFIILKILYTLFGINNNNSMILIFNNKIKKIANRIFRIKYQRNCVRSFSSR